MDNKTEMTISDKIFELLNERGMTQKEFSEKTGIPQSTISDWKGKHVNPASDKIMIICQILDVSPYDILSGTESDKYEMPDFIITGKNSEEYLLINRYRNLSSSYKNRLLGYLDALEQLSKK